MATSCDESKCPSKAAEEMAPEPLLTPNPQRFVLFPIQYKP